MKTIAIIFLLIFPTLCYAEWPEKWTATDTALELAFIGVTVIDHGQTRWASRQSRTGIEYVNGKYVFIKRHQEQNPILGKNPHPDKIDLYFASVYILHPVVSASIPKKWAVPIPFCDFSVPIRTIWQSITFGVETNTITENFSIGARARF